ncbi:hypothetical protein AB0E67_18075 [Streptomyces sp. NPDC032161]|uniref:hypothetical protein n=1 Tax=unclassified Streptomyces TaxID=2593676 RepID=UPI0033C004B9
MSRRDSTNGNGDDNGDGYGGGEGCGVDDGVGGDGGGDMSRDGGVGDVGREGGEVAPENGREGGRESGSGQGPGTDRTGNAMVNDGREGAVAPDGAPGMDARATADGDADAAPEARTHEDAGPGGAVSGNMAPEVRGHDGVGPEVQAHARADVSPGAEADPGRGADAGMHVGAGGGDATHTGSVTVVGFGSRRGDGGTEAPDFLDEVALRRMLHGAVQHIEPGQGVLGHLQRAVPARRARRRQAVVGMAAAALLIGTAIPAFVHVANSDGSNTANPAIAGHGEQAQGGNGTENGSGSSGKAPGGGTDGQDDRDPDHPVSTSSPSGSGGQGTEGDLAGGVSDPAASLASAPPACDAGQLGVASAQTGAAGADGTVYGTFRIANVSDTECSVSGGGSVGFQALGAADPAKITVVRHAAGDAAAGLPDPSQEQDAVALKPSMTYEVRFAWVPRDTCPTVGGSPSPTPTEGTGGAGGGTAAGAGPGTGTGSGEGAVATVAQLGGEDGGLQDGSVAVTHTPEAGAPVAETKIANACAGTIYRTGVLAPTT